ncbi:unnamed protein product [Diamesa tonsa]
MDLGNNLQERIVKNIQENTVTTVVTAGAVIICCIILAQYFHKVAIKFRGVTAYCEKKPENQRPPVKNENIGNIDDTYLKEVKNRNLENADEFDFEAENDVINCGNVSQTYNENVEGGTAFYKRKINCTNNPKKK